MRFQNINYDQNEATRSVIENSKWKQGFKGKMYIGRPLYGSVDEVKEDNKMKHSNGENS